MAPMVRFRGVVKTHDEMTVLDRLDLDVAQGEKVAIIGSSGSGKTTLLRILSTVEGFDAGSVEVDGERIDSRGDDEKLGRHEREHLRRIAARIAMVFQDFELFPHLTAAENCTAAAVHGRALAEDEAEERAYALLAMVGLGDKAEEYPSELSRWEQQRVAIARALAGRPKILLIDGINSSLDAALLSEVLEAMRRSGEDKGLTVIAVTNQIHFAKRCFDRICFLDEGRIVEQGTPEALFADPANRRSRAFLSAEEGG